MKTPLSKLKKKVDNLFSLFIRTRDGFRCKKCGKVSKNVHCAHIFSRNKLSVRYEPKNAITLCYYCHLMWAHREPVEFTEWVRGEIGEKTCQEIKKQSLIMVPDPREFMEKMKKLYEIQTPKE